MLLKIELFTKKGIFGANFNKNQRKTGIILQKLGREKKVLLNEEERFQKLHHPLTFNSQ